MNICRRRARVSATLSGLFAVCFFVLPSAYAQYELIIIEKPFTAHSLSGVVVDPTGSPIPGAAVEECEAPFTPIEAKDAQGKPNGEVLHGDCTKAPSHVVATTETNSHGHFSLPKAKTGTIFHLHVSSPGFDPMQITVRLKFFARAGVRVRLHIAT